MTSSYVPDAASGTADGRPFGRDDDSARDAAALVERFGAADVEWLDQFLANYVFVGEPLDRVLTKARALSKLAPRPMQSGLDDD